MSSFSGLKGPSFLPELEGPGRLQICKDKTDEGEDEHRRIIVTFGNRHAIRYDLEDNSVMAGYYCPTFMTLSTPLAYDSSLSSYVCGVNAGKDLLIWDGQEIKLQNIINNHKHARLQEKDTVKVNQQTVITLKANEVAVGLTHLTNVSCGDQGPECYVVFKNGQLQTVKYLVGAAAFKDEENTENNSTKFDDIVPTNSVRLETSLFIDEERNSLIYVAHAYRLGKNCYVQVCRLLLDAETGRCRQTLLNKLDLNLKCDDTNTSMDHQNKPTQKGVVSCLTFYGPILTYLTLNGELRHLNILDGENRKSLQCLNKSDAAVIDFAPMNLTPDTDQTISLMSLDRRRIALVGPRRDNEGYTITVVDAVFDVVVASSRIKTVHAEKDAKETGKGNVSYVMVCHAGKRIFFKHGSKVANVILSEELPSRLSGFVGHEANLDILPKAEDKKYSNLKSKIETNGVENEVPEWETIKSVKDCKDDSSGEASQTLDLYRRMPEILAKRDFSEIETILDTYNDIPELLVLNIIEALIMERFDRKKTVPESERKGTQPTLVWSNRANLLKAFNLPITETLMIQHLRQCRFELAKNMLVWLYKEMKDTKRKQEKVNINQGLMWIGLILNTHYTNFILSKTNEEVSNLLFGAAALLEDTTNTLEVLTSILPPTKLICNASKDKLSSTACSSAAVVGLMRSSSIINNVGNMANRAYSIELVEL